MPCECGALAVRNATHPGAALLERLRALEEALTRAAAELRHAYPPETRDWNLVSRAIIILERVTTPKSQEAMP